MTKKVRMYGRDSLERARLYVQKHPERDLVILKNSQTWQIAVCSSDMAAELKTQGFQPVASEG